MSLHLLMKNTVSLPKRIFLALPDKVRGTLSLSLIILNIFWCASVIFPIALLKFLIRIRPFQELCNRQLIRSSVAWIGRNNLNMSLTKNLRCQVTGIEDLKPVGWYLVLSNHQTWVDIFILQKVFHKKIPFLKFFLKKELIWVPIMGLAWWALDFPFMRRYTKEFLKKNPHLEGKDMEITRKACEKFKDMPVSVMNFVEGTRFTKAKHKRQQSPFKHLLKPKAGGISFVLSAMGGHLTHIVNTTIIYPQGPKTFWDFLCARDYDVVVNAEVVPITPDLMGDYTNDPKFRDHFQAWLNILWEEKDRFIDEFFLEKRKAA